MYWVVKLSEKELFSFLKKVTLAFEKQDIFGLKEIANQAIENASLANNKRLASLALVAYCLHKMCSKQHIVRDGRWPEIKHDILFDLKKSAKSLEAIDLDGFDHCIDGVIGSVKQADEEIGNYVQNLFEKAKVKYASTAYGMGLSLGQSAALTGSDKKDLLRYIGVTRIADRDTVTYGIGKRLRQLKRKMGVKKK